MAKKLTLLLTLLIMIRVVFSASEDTVKSSPVGGRNLVVNRLNLSKVVSDPNDPDLRSRRTVGDIVADLSLKQAFPPAKFSVVTSKGEQLTIVRSDKRFRIERSSPLYAKVEQAAQDVELEKVTQYAQDHPGEPPLALREVTPEDRHAILCALFEININMSNKEILMRIAKRVGKNPEDVKYEALGMVPKERPDNKSLFDYED
jgi:hypothetical protein